MNHLSSLDDKDVLLLTWMESVHQTDCPFQQSVVLFLLLRWRLCWWSSLILLLLTFTLTHRLAEQQSC